MKKIQIGKNREDKPLLVSDKQAESFERVMERQGMDRYEGAYYDHLCDCLMVHFNDIIIGIEPDGYAHS